MSTNIARNSTLLVAALTLAALAVLLGVPFAMRPPEASVVDAQELVIISPHDEAVKEEFQRAFSEWHASRFGRPVRITWPNLGGGGDIKRYIESQFNAEFRRTLGKLPPKDMPWQSIDRPSTQDDQQVRRWREQLASAGIGVDIFFGGGDFDQSQFKWNGWSVPIELPPGHDYYAHVPHLLGGVPMFDVDGWCPRCRQWLGGVATSQPACNKCRGPVELADSHYWFGAVLTRVGIISNNIVCDKLHVPADRRPQTWADLADPVYRGNLALADPNFSGSAKLCYEMVLQRHGWAEGWRLLTQIAANARYFGASSTQTALDVSRCDAAAGMIIDYYGRTQVADVGREPDGCWRLEYVSPAGATATTPDPISIIRGAPNRQVAERFVQFVLSVAGQKLWMGKVGSPGGPRRSGLYRPPIRRDIYDNFSADMIYNDNPFQDATTFNLDKPVQDRRFSFLGVLMRAAFIDNADLLKRAADRARAAAPGSPARRQFDSLPFDEGDYRSTQPGDDSMWGWVNAYKAARSEPDKEAVAGRLVELFRAKYQRVLNAETR